MMENNVRKRQAKLLRVFRKIHRTTGALLFIFFFIVAITAFIRLEEKQPWIHCGKIKQRHIHRFKRLAFYRQLTQKRHYYFA